PEHFSYGCSPTPQRSWAFSAKKTPPHNCSGNPSNRKNAPGMTCHGLVSMWPETESLFAAQQTGFSVHALRFRDKQGTNGKLPHSSVEMTLLKEAIESSEPRPVTP